MPAGASRPPTTAMIAPPIATAPASASRSSPTSKAKKNAGKTASTPSASGLGRTPPATTPMIVPVCQVRYCAADEPKSVWRSKRPSPRLAIAQDASTTAWPSSARRTRPPLSDGPIASPIAM